MAFTNGAGLAIGGDRSEARKVVVSGKRDDSVFKAPPPQAQDGKWVQLGDVVIPVLIAVRELLNAGIAPDEAIAIHRRGLRQTKVMAGVTGGADALLIDSLTIIGGERQ
jgi:hypothetical protein